jgi:hypothetical protein
MAFYMVFISITPAGEQRPEEIPSWHDLYVKPLSSRCRGVAKLEERRLVCSSGMVIESISICIKKKAFINFSLVAHIS